MDGCLAAPPVVVVGVAWWDGCVSLGMHLDPSDRSAMAAASNKQFVSVGVGNNGSITPTETTSHTNQHTSKQLPIRSNERTTIRCLCGLPGMRRVCRRLLDPAIRQTKKPSSRCGVFPPFAQLAPAIFSALCVVCCLGGWTHCVQCVHAKPSRQARQLQSTTHAWEGKGRVCVLLLGLVGRKKGKKPQGRSLSLAHPYTHYTTHHNTHYNKQGSQTASQQQEPDSQQ